jgi:hypothetical protein
MYRKMHATYLTLGTVPTILLWLNCSENAILRFFCDLSFWVVLFLMNLSVIKVFPLHTMQALVGRGSTAPNDF